MRRIVVLAAVMGVLVVACGGSAPSTISQSTHATACSDSSYVHPGTVTVGTDNPAYPPYFQGGHPKDSQWKLNDPNTGKGFESAVAYALARELGFPKADVTWVVAPFVQTYAPGPKNWDFAIEQISYSKKRARAVDFSESYYDESEALIAVKGTPIASAKSIADLKDYRLAAPTGTTSYDIITDVIQPNKEPGSYNSLADTVAAINAHAVDGIVVDYPTALYMADPYVQQVKNSVVVGQFPPTTQSEHFGLTFVKGNPLVDCVNDALARLKSSGKLQAITTEWLSKKTNVGEVPVFATS